VRPSGSAVTTQPVFTANVVLPVGVSTDLVALGTGSGFKGPTATPSPEPPLATQQPTPATTPPAKQAFQLAVFTTERAPTRGRSRIEVINAAVGVGTVDVLQDNKPVLSEIKFGKMGNAPINLDPGTYHFAIAPTGKTTPVVADMASVQLKADTIYTYIVVSRQPGNANPTALSLTSTSVQNLPPVSQGQTPTAQMTTAAQATAAVTMTTTVTP